eukprot:g1820.t1
MNMRMIQRRRELDNQPKMTGSYPLPNRRGAFEVKHFFRDNMHVSSSTRQVRIQTWLANERRVLDRSEVRRRELMNKKKSRNDEREEEMSKLKDVFRLTRPPTDFQYRELEAFQEEKEDVEARKKAEKLFEKVKNNDETKLLDKATSLFDREDGRSTPVELRLGLKHFSAARIDNEEIERAIIKEDIEQKSEEEIQQLQKNVEITENLSSVVEHIDEDDDTFDINIEEKMDEGVCVVNSGFIVSQGFDNRSDTTSAVLEEKNPTNSAESRKSENEMETISVPSDVDASSTAKLPKNYRDFQSDDKDKQFGVKSLSSRALISSSRRNQTERATWRDYKPSSSSSSTGTRRPKSAARNRKRPSARQRPSSAKPSQRARNGRQRPSSAKPSQRSKSKRQRPASAQVLRRNQTSTSAISGSAITLRRRERPVSAFAPRRGRSGRPIYPAGFLSSKQTRNPSIGARKLLNKTRYIGKNDAINLAVTTRAGQLRGSLVKSRRQNPKRGVVRPFSAQPRMRQQRKKVSTSVNNARLQSANSVNTRSNSATYLSRITLQLNISGADESQNKKGKKAWAKREKESTNLENIDAKELKRLQSSASGRLYQGVKSKHIFEKEAIEEEQKEKEKNERLRASQIAERRRRVASIEEVMSVATNRRDVTEDDAVLIKRTSYRRPDIYRQRRIHLSKGGRNKVTFVANKATRRTLRRPQSAAPRLQRKRNKKGIFKKRLDLRAIRLESDRKIREENAANGLNATKKKAVQKTREKEIRLEIKVPQ